MSPDNWHNFEVGPKEYHAYFKARDLNYGVRVASRIALDRAREAGHNPRNGVVTIHFEDDGVNAKWTENP
jgi:hypothetical protein